MTECPLCGAENLPGAGTCESCGADITTLGEPSDSSLLVQKLLGTPIRDLPLQPAISVDKYTMLDQGIGALADSESGALLVTESHQVVGIITHNDIMHKIGGVAVDLSLIPVGTVMTPDPKMLDGEDTLAMALHRMAVGGYRHNPVRMGDGEIRMLTVLDLLRYLSQTRDER